MQDKNKLTELINSINVIISKVSKQIKKLEFEKERGVFDGKLVCYFPENCLSVSVQPSGKFWFSSSLFPRKFNPKQASWICKNVMSINGKSPVFGTPLEYYKCRYELAISCKRILLEKKFKK